eukprot:252820_1
MVSETILNLSTFKAIMIGAIFCSGLFGVLSPRLFRPYGSKLSYASLFSSGILLSAAIVHLLGDADKSLSNSPLPDFPWAYFLCGLSFYLLYFFERFFIHFFAHNEHEHDDTPQHPKGELNTPLTFERIDPRVDSFRLRQSGSRTRSIFEDPLFDDHGEDILRLMKQKNSLSGFVLLLGLGLHSFLAGMGFGSSDDMTQAFALAIAILAHKYLAAFALGCPFFQSGVPLKQHIMIAVIFSIITPSGIGIGWALSDEFDSWVSDIFVSIAAGTFIYVALIEILVPEFSETKQKEKLLMKIEEQIQNMHLEKMNVGQKTRAGIKRNVGEKVSSKQELNHNRVEATKSIAVLSGFVLMSILAIWT